MRCMRSKKQALVLLVLITTAITTLQTGCTARKQARVDRAFKQAGTQEPGTRAYWVRGQETVGEKKLISRSNSQWASSAREFLPQGKGT